MINLCFHGIGKPARELEPGEARYWITEDLFAAVLDEVVGRDDVGLSFDDGNSSDVEIGLPGLVERGLTATFFVIAARLDQPGSLSSEQVRGLRARGMTIGSHGMDHVPWRSLGDSAVQRELVDARDLLAATAGAPVEEAALPRGQYERRTLGHLRRLGYAHVHTSDRQASSPDAWLQHRFSLRTEDTVATLRTGVLGSRPLVDRMMTRVKSAVKQIR